MGGEGQKGDCRTNAAGLGRGCWRQWPGHGGLCAHSPSSRVLAVHPARFPPCCDKAVPTQTPAPQSHLWSPRLGCTPWSVSPALAHPFLLLAVTAHRTWS